MTECGALVICDAGPLIHLDELGELELLADFSTVLITETVWKEVIRHRQIILEGLPVQILPDSLPDAPLQTLASALALDAGEVTALALAQQHPAALFVTDDAAARLAAAQMQLKVHGTLGLLLRAVRRKLRSGEHIRNILATLRERSTLYIRQDLLDQAIEALEKYQPCRVR